VGDRLGIFGEPFRQRVLKGENPEKVLDDLGVTRYCCRRTLLAHIELIDQVLEYSRIETE
jgi:DNA-directed RNA polymerase, subunit N (EC 2.7.7.6)